MFHNCALVSVEKRYPLHARKVMHALWGMGQMQFTKCIVVVDADVDVHDYAQVAWRVFNNVDWKRDVLVTEGPLDVLDHSSPQPLWGGKIGIDATQKGPDEGHPREWPPDVEMSAEVKARVDELWPQLGLGLGDVRRRPARPSRGAGSSVPRPTVRLTRRGRASHRDRHALRPPLRQPGQVRALHLRPAVRVCGGLPGRGGRSRASGACSGSPWPWWPPAASAWPSTG